MSTSEGIYTEIIDKIETPSASVLLVKLLLKEGKTEIAIKACLKALEIFPDGLYPISCFYIRGRDSEFALIM